MAGKEQPTARRIGLGYALRDLRRESGLTLDQAVAGLPFDRTTLNRVEMGYRSLRAAAPLRELLAKYGVEDEEEVARLVALQREGSSREWWTSTSELIAGMPRFLGVEAAAREIRGFHPAAIPGLLQTEAYARALHALHRPVDDTTVAFVESSVRTRMRRQEVLTDPEPLKLWAVLYEPALRYCLADPETMRQQYDHLRNLAMRDNVILQVLPQSSRGYLAFHDVNIMVLEQGLPTAVQVDTAWFTVAVTDKPKEVARFNRMFDAMAASALAPDATPDVLTRLAREIAP